MGGQVRQDVEGGVLILTIDNPPVNASSQGVRAGIAAGIQRLVSDPALVAAVLIGAGDSFVAGSDLGEFGGTVPEPLLPSVIADIEDCAKPVVAALDGFALGGGLELALGCDARLASQRAQVGLPEVTLGMVPGAGGTQRLPRLVGREAALEIILSGRRVPAVEAHELGIVDEIVTGDLLSAAVRYATTARKRRVAELAVPDSPTEDLEAVVGRVVRGARRANAVAALELVGSAGSGDIETALRRERERFDELRLSPDAAALRHIFFAERAASRRAGTTPRQPGVDRVGIIGAGAMGAGIGAAFALAGIGVQLIDTDATQAQRGRERIQQTLDKAVARGRLSVEAAVGVSARLGASTDLADLGDADLVIEAVVEDPEVKASVLRAAAVAAPDAVLATNTSYLSVSRLAESLEDPSRLVGMHFFNPADVMKLVELVPGSTASPRTLGVALQASKQLRKVAVLAGDAEGFIGNRIYSVYRRHAEYLLEDGALPEDVDAAMEGFGFGMGPFAVADLSGLQIARSLRDRWRSTGRLPARYVDIPDLLCDRGWWGRRSGRGYYRYDEGVRTPDPRVHELIVAESARKGIRRRAIGAEEIVTRLVGAMVVEGAKVVAEGVAQHPDDVDVVVVNGFGFPRFLGGPMWWARRQDAETLTRLADVVASAAREDAAGETLADVLGGADARA